jgi:hypothetical protein
LRWRSYGEVHDEKQAKKYPGLSREQKPHGDAHFVILERGSLDGYESVDGKRFWVFRHASGAA